MRSAWLLVALGLSLVSVGCQSIKERLAAKDDERAVETASSGHVDAPSGSGFVTLSGKDGAIIAMGGDAVKVPDNWPKSVPPYPAGTLKGSMSTTTGKMHASLTYETPDDPAKVLEFYSTNLKGFTKASELNLGGNVVASYEGDGKVVAITLAKSPATKNTVLSLLVTDKS